MEIIYLLSFYMNLEIHIIKVNHPELVLTLPVKQQLIIVIEQLDPHFKFVKSFLRLFRLVASTYPNQFHC